MKSVNRQDAKDSTVCPIVKPHKNRVDTVARYVIADPSTLQYHTVWCQLPGGGKDKTLILTQSEALTQNYSKCVCGTATTTATATT